MSILRENLSGHALSARFVNEKFEEKGLKSQQKTMLPVHKVSFA